MAQAARRPFIGIILLPYIICFFAEKGVWPSYPASMQPMVAEMSQLILTQKDDQIRNYCRGKFAGHGNESIKSVIIRKLFNKLKIGAIDPPIPTAPMPPDETTVTPLPQVNMTSEATPAPETEPPPPTLPPDVETIPPQTEPPPPTEPPPTEPPPVTDPPPTEAPPTVPPEPPTEIVDPATETPAPDTPNTQPVMLTTVSVDDKLDMGAGDMRPATDAEKLKAQLALSLLFSYNPSDKGA